MKALTKTQKIVIDFLTEQGGEGAVVTGHRWPVRGFLKDTRTPVIGITGQALEPMLTKGLIVRVEGGPRWIYRLPSFLPDPQIPVGPFAGA